MPEHLHDRGHRTRHARTFLIVVFLLQRLGDVAVIGFTFFASASALLLRGLAIGSLMWTTVFLVGVWRRLRWARYVLTGFGWAYAVLLCGWVLSAWDELKPILRNPYLALVAGAILYVAANVILVRSRRVRHFANK
jgi:hypothetical protein